ncbi:MAG: hypothetical protein ACK561_15145 [Pseudomonadaceae bacterium]
MAPVETHGIDAPVDALGQLIATSLTFCLAVVALVWVLGICTRERITWPLLVLLGGLLTCLLEPLFDHLYGLWFFEEGQWNLYTTFGSAQPIWVPPAYLAFYGGAAIFIVRALQARPTMATVWRMYWAIVAVAIIAEMTYVSVLRVYSYQDSQPFVVFGYPIFLGFTNAMSALVGGILIYRLLPFLRGLAGTLALLSIIPGAFAMGLFGTGILYLSVRHSVDEPNMLLVHLAALTLVGGIAATVRLLGHVLVVGSSAEVMPSRPRFVDSDDTGN